MELVIYKNGRSVKQTTHLRQLAVLRLPGAIPKQSYPYFLGLVLTSGQNNNNSSEIVCILPGVGSIEPKLVAIKEQ
jgi:hypothetical protein